MTGRPKLQLFSQTIEGLGGDDWFFDQVAGCTPMQKIAEQVGCSRPQLYAWMNDKPGRRERYKEAQKVAAAGYAEDSASVLDDLDGRPIEPVHVQLARARSDQKWKMATVLDRETYGENKAGLNVTIDIGQLHLDALRAKGSMSLAHSAPTLIGTPVVEATTEVEAE